MSATASRGHKGARVRPGRTDVTAAPEAVPAPGTGAEPGLASLAPPLLEPIAAGRYDLRVLNALRRIIRAVDLHSRKLMTGHGVTGPQLVCLLSLREKGPDTLNAMARRVHLSPSTMIGIVDRLEAKGLVRRERDLRDRRLVHVALTEQGGQVAASAPSPLQDTLAKAMGELPESEQATIAASLDRIVDMMEARHVAGAPIPSAEPGNHAEVEPGDTAPPDAAESEP